MSKLVPGSAADSETYSLAVRTLKSDFARTVLVLPDKRFELLRGYSFTVRSQS